MGRVTQTNFCEILPKPLSDVSGEPNNIILRPIHLLTPSDIRWSDYYRKYIPDSFGYPLSVTNYREQ